MIFFENRTQEENIRVFKDIMFLPPCLDTLFLFWKMVEDSFLSSYRQDKLFSGMAGLV